MDEKISVIMACYNCEKTVDKASFIEYGSYRGKISYCTFSLIQSGGGTEDQ